ncbi:14919_t:CDS:2, partial [Gigaspora rosea]
VGLKVRVPCGTKTLEIDRLDKPKTEDPTTCSLCFPLNQIGIDLNNYKPDLTNDPWT